MLIPTFLSPEMFFILSCSSSGIVTLAFRTSFFFSSFFFCSSSFLAISSLCFLSQFLILYLAAPDLTNFSHASEGRAFLLVSTSIISPLFSLVLSGTSLLLTLAPEHLCPTSVCIEYAKSTGVAPFASFTIIPFGVNTKISSS